MMIDEILQYIILLPVSFLVDYIKAKYFVDIRKKETQFDRIPNQSIQQCIKEYRKTEMPLWQKLNGTTFFSKLPYIYIHLLISILFTVSILVFSFMYIKMFEHPLFINRIESALNSFFNSVLFNGNDATVKYDYPYVYSLVSFFFVTSASIYGYHKYSHGVHEQFQTSDDQEPGIYTSILDYIDLYLIYYVLFVFTYLRDLPFYLIPYQLFTPILLTFLVSCLFFFFQARKIKIKCKAKLKSIFNERYKMNFPEITISTKGGQIVKGKIETVFTDDIIVLNDGVKTTTTKWVSIESLEIENQCIDAREILLS